MVIDRSPADPGINKGGADMAYNRNGNRNGNRQAAQEPDYLVPDSWEVQRVRETRRGDLYFTLMLNGVTINNCHVAHTQDNREFVALPQYRGSDGNYYSVVYARLSEELQAEIIAEAMGQLK